MPLSGGETLISHLGMSGRYTVFPPRAARPEGLGEFYFQPAAERKPGVHDHLRLRLDDGTEIVYTDPRRFGLFDLTRSEAAFSHPMLAGLGPEPLDARLFTPEYLAGVLAQRQAPIKSVLLDQSVVAGIGNIYACEALHLAGISPRRAARSLAPSGRPGKRVRRLVAAIREVLRAAIEAGGSTLKDHARVSGEAGDFQQQFAVYGRAGAPCWRCGAPVRQIVQGGRSTYYCGRCQR
jgi:formamidopyrimidine-DNA glycosylase